MIEAVPRVVLTHHLASVPPDRLMDRRSHRNGGALRRARASESPAVLEQVFGEWLFEALSRPRCQAIFDRTRAAKIVGWDQFVPPGRAMSRHHSYQSPRSMTALGESCRPQSAGRYARTSKRPFGWRRASQSARVSHVGLPGRCEHTLEKSQDFWPLNPVRWLRDSHFV